MSAIAGYVGRGREHAEAACTKILAGLAPFGPDQQQLRALEITCFGRALFRTLPEDDFDRQPLIGMGGRCLLVADARIDNREELGASLGLGAVALKRLSDADVLLAAWERWELGCFDRTLGDVALAVWQRDSGRLVLARSPNSSKPLFWAAGSTFVAFASLPQGLHELAEIPKRLNLSELAGTAAGLPYLTDETIFAGVHRVPHGHAIEWRGDQVTRKRLWDLDRVPFGSFAAGDYGEALRSELDRAVRARTRRRSGPLASHLSAGRDSSAVTATASLILRDKGEELLALTGTPRSGFSGPAMSGRLVDESPFAAKTAAFHPNIRHFTCRSDPVDLGMQINRFNATHFGPILNIRSIPWWTSVHDRGSAEGASVVLGAGTGNLSISAGGIRHLGDLLHRRGPAAWLSTAFGQGGLSPSRWRSIANFTFGPRLPASLYKAARGLAGRERNRLAGVHFLRPSLGREAERLLSENLGDPRPPQSEYAYRRDLLLRRDIGEKQTLAMWAIDLRDPTADRRVVELCLSLPPEQLVSAQSERPAFEAAFADRLPIEVLKNRQRGYQNADWFEHFRKETVEALLHDYRRHRAVREILDFNYIDDAVANWPTGGWTNPEVRTTYGFELLAGLSLAAFISLHWPD